MPDAVATFAPRRPLDLARTLSALGQGRFDPLCHVTDDGVWRASRTPEGPATLRLRHRRGPAGAADAGGTGVDAGPFGLVRAEAWGPGAAWAVGQAPELVGEGDDVEAFDGLAGAHPLVADLHRRHPGLRIPRTGRVFESMVPTICGQKVTGIEAKRAYHGILRTWGEPAPAPPPAEVPRAPRLRLLPTPADLARQPSWAFHEHGLERKRAEALLRVAAAAGRLEEAVAMGREDARRRLRAVPGIGVWSSAEVALVALGDADAVSVGDYHLPNIASWHLAGEPRGTDERMLELLEPFRPHRGRALRLLCFAGMPPRYGPRMSLRGFELQ